MVTSHRQGQVRLGFEADRVLKLSKRVSNRVLKFSNYESFRALKIFNRVLIILGP